jgi:hypothetical protein
MRTAIGLPTAVQEAPAPSRRQRVSVAVDTSGDGTEVNRS